MGARRADEQARGGCRVSLRSQYSPRFVVQATWDGETWHDGRMVSKLSIAERAALMLKERGCKVSIAKVEWFRPTRLQWRPVE
jgi:hypothetical protein